MSGWPPVASVLLGIFLPMWVTLFWGGVYRLLGWLRRWHPFTCWFCSSAGGAIGALSVHNWAYASGAAVSAAIAGIVWWWRRRKRRRALQALGAKAKARIAAMKQAMRERARPRVVLRPGLQGAR